MSAFDPKRKSSGQFCCGAQGKLPSAKLIHRFQPADVFLNHSQMNFQALEINLERAGNL
jgi:hypothetical protein